MFFKCQNFIALNSSDTTYTSSKIEVEAVEWVETVKMVEAVKLVEEV